MARATRRLKLVSFIGIALLACFFTAPARAQKPGALAAEFNAALADYNSGQFAKAASELENLARRLPSSFQVHELLGLVYSAQSNDKEANVHFNRAVELNPKSAVARANLGVNLAKLGEDARAQEEFKRAIAIDPANYEANKDLGETYLGVGKLRWAIPYLEKAQHIHDTYENGYNLALAYVETAQSEKAKPEIEQLLEQHDTAELHNLLGDVDEKLGDYIAAANEYQRAAEMDPTESNLFDWGVELLVHHTLDPATEVFSQGLERFPGSARMAVGLGLAFYGRGSYDNAVKALLKATDLAPSDPRSYYFLSKAYDSSPRQADEVIERFRRFAELRPGDGKAQFYYAMSLWKGNQTGTSGAILDQVESLLKKAASLDPSLSDAYFELGNLYSQQKKFAEAIPQYERAIKLDPDSAPAHYRLGQAYVHVGNKNLAQSEFRIHQRLYQQHLAESDKQRAAIREFVYSLKSSRGRE